MSRLSAHINKFVASFFIFLSSSIAIADFGSVDGIREIEVLTNFLNDGDDALAILGVSNLPKIELYSASQSSPLQTYDLNVNYDYLDIEVLNSAGSIAQTAVLSTVKNGNGSRIWLWQPQTQSTTSIALGGDLIPRDLEIIQAGELGGPLLVTIGQRRSNGDAQAIVASPSPQTPVSYLDLGSDWYVDDLEVESFGNVEMLAVLGRTKSTGSTRVRTFDISTGVKLHDIRFGPINAIDFISLRDQEIPAYALLRQKSNKRFIYIDHRNSEGKRLGLTLLDSSSEPKKIIPWQVHPDDDDVFGVFTENESHQHGELNILSRSTGDVITSYNFGSGAHSHDIASLNEFSGTQIAVVETRRIDQYAQLKFQQASGERIRTIPLENTSTNPHWFTDSRVHGHTRLSHVDPRRALRRSWYNSAQSDGAATYFKGLGASVYTRHAITADEDPWWPSFSPSSSDGTSLYSHDRINQGIPVEANENAIQGYVNNAWSEDLPMLAYYADSAEENLAVEHPDWVCHDHNGNVASHNTKGIYLDLTSQYGDIVKQRLLELADMGASGIYLDFRHMPANGCWSSTLNSLFFQETGLTAPRIGGTAEYQQYVEFFAQQVVRVIKGWHDSLKQEYPAVPLVISVTSIPALTRTDMSSRLAAVDIPKSEFKLATARGQNNSVFHNNASLYEPREDVRMALGWSLLRDISARGLPHIWNAFTPNREHMLSFISAVTAYGAIAALDVVEELLIPGSTVNGITPRSDLKAGFAYGQLISDTLRSTTPTQWVGIHFSENSRNEYRRNSLAAWQSLLLPTVGAFQAASERALGIKILTDDTLTNGELQGLTSLFLPDPTNLNTGQQAAIYQFLSGGGDLIENNNIADWTNETSYLAQVQHIKDAFSQHTLPPVESDLPAGVHLVPHHEGGNNARIVLAVSNEFDYVQSTTIYHPLPASLVNSPPTPVPTGTIVKINSTHPIFTLINNAGLQAVDRLTGNEIIFNATQDSIELTLPAFQTMLLVELK